MPKYCDCEVGSCEGMDDRDRCVVRAVAILMDRDRHVDRDDQDSLKRLRSGADVIVPKSKHHAECMLLIAEKYLEAP